MSLKSKLIAAAASKTLEKIAESDMVDKVINATLDNIGKVTGQDATSTKISLKRNFYVVIKSRSCSVKTIIKTASNSSCDLGDNWGKHKIYDDFENLRYISELKGNNLFEDFADFFFDYDKDTIYIFDSSNKIVGKIKENLFSFKLPLLEKDVKSCTVFLDENIHFSIRRYYSFNNLCYDVSGYDYSLSPNSDKSIEIKKAGKAIANIHRVSPVFKDDFTDNLIVEFDDMEDEISVILLALALDMIGE